MIIFYLIVLAALIALGVVFWLIWKESSLDPSNSLDSKKSKEPISAASLLDKLGLEKNVTNTINPTQKTKKIFTNPFKKQTAPAAGSPLIPPFNDTLLPKSGTAALRLDNNSITAQQSIDKEVALAIKNDELKKEIIELQEKQQKIENLLTEKTDSLEKTRNELEQERKHRKEFNKIKDLLEKEIKDTKDALKKTDNDLQTAKIEHQGSASRILQLEEKIKLIEKKSYEKDALIDELTQKISDATPTGETLPTTLEKKLAVENAISAETTIKAEVPRLTETEPHNAPLEQESDPKHPMETVPADQSDTGTQLTQEPTPEKEKSSADQDNEIQTNINPMPFNLTPISNLEKTYETEAAPITDDDKLPAADEKPDDQATPVEIPSQDDDIVRPSDAGQTMSAIETDIDNFLKENLDSNHTEYVAPDDPSIEIDEKVAEMEPPKEVMPKQEEQKNQTDEEEQPSSKNHAKLAPDIFKDIEEQFKKIEEEMNATTDDQNIETDNTRPPDQENP